MNKAEPRLTMALAERMRPKNTDYRQRLVEKASQLEDVIVMGLGDPDASSPQHVIEAAQKAIIEGQTKYTHLKDQDTTDRDSPFFKQSRKMRDKYVSKMGGMGGTGGGFEKPSNKKR